MILYSEFCVQGPNFYQFCKIAQYSQLFQPSLIIILLTHFKYVHISLANIISFFEVCKNGTHDIHNNFYTVEMDPLFTY